MPMDSADDAGSFAATEGADTSASGAGTAEVSASPEQTDAAAAAPTAASGSEAQAPDSQAKGPADSLTPPTDAAQQPQDESFRSRWENTRKWGLQNQNRALQLERDLQAMKQQFDGVDPAQLRQWREAQKTAEAQKLPIYNPRNPANAGFRSAYERHRYAQDVLSRTPAEQRDAMKQSLYGAFTTNDLQAIREFEVAREDATRRFSEDPDAFLEERFERFFEQRINAWHQNVAQNYEFEQKVQGDVTKWFSDPSNKTVVDSQREDMLRRLQSGERWDIVRRDAEINHLKGRVGESSKAKQAADERDRLLKSSAANTITRDGVARPVTDLAEQAKKIGAERGYRPGDPRYLKLLDELRTQHA